MHTRHLVIALVAAGVLAAAGWGAYSIGMQRGMAMAGGAADAAAADGAPAPPSAAAGTLPHGIAQGEEATRRHIASGLRAGDMDPVVGRTILHYHDPMMPVQKFDRPGKSPFMDMMLVPVYAGADGADASSVTISPRVRQNLGLRTAEVVEEKLSPQLAAVGSVAYNERDQVVVQSRSAGFVEKLHVRATLDRVATGAPLAELYLPDWVAVQEEFLALRRMSGPDLAPLVDAARQRMRQAGMSEAQVAQVEAGGKLVDRIVLNAPIGGVVTEIGAREGMAVMAGATLFRINGLATVWANAEVPETQAGWLRPGAAVRASSPALPGASFDGRVQAILPEVDPATRTMKARLELRNPQGRLVPGMFVQMQFVGAGKRALLVPTDAVIQTGRRSLVMLADGDDGHYRPVQVETGTEIDGKIEIRKGLQAGQRVVVAAQFLVDSEASLRGIEARLAAEPARHEVDGTVESLDGETVTLTHGPVPALKWDTMTMEFKLAPKAAPPGLKAGDAVRFEFLMDERDGPTVTRLTRAAKPGGRP